MTIAFTIKFNRQDGTADVDGDTTLLFLLCSVFINASAKFGYGMMETPNERIARQNY